MAKRLSRQQVKKLYKKECLFCGQNDYQLLDVHRLCPGSEGGTYDPRNTVVACAICHRKQGNRIIVHGKYYTSSAVWKVHYTEDGEEKWKEE